MLINAISVHKEEREREMSAKYLLDRFHFMYRSSHSRERNHAGCTTFGLEYRRRFASESRGNLRQFIQFGFRYFVFVMCKEMFLSRRISLVETELVTLNVFTCFVFF